MKKTTNKNKSEREVTVDGLMTFGQLENGERTMDFACCENVDMEAFAATCRVQVMRDGNVYVTERPRRVRNRPLFREDNASLSLGRDGRFYFIFSLPQQLVEELPRELARQASAIAAKVLRELIRVNG